MEDYNRSRSYSYSSYGSNFNNNSSSSSNNNNNKMMQLERYYDPPRLPYATTSYELRSYSASYAQSQIGNNNYNPNGFSNNRDLKLKKGKSTSGSVSKSWTLSDPEFQRKKRVASYKMYSVEGKVKGTFRKSFRWLKDRYTQVVYGW